MEHIAIAANRCSMISMAARLDPVFLRFSDPALDGRYQARASHASAVWDPCFQNTRLAIACLTFGIHLCRRSDITVSMVVLMLGYLGAAALQAYLSKRVWYQLHRTRNVICIRDPLPDIMPPLHTRLANAACGDIAGVCESLHIGVWSHCCLPADFYVAKALDTRHLDDTCRALAALGLFDETHLRSTHIQPNRTKHAGPSVYCCSDTSTGPAAVSYSLLYKVLMC